MYRELQVKRFRQVHLTQYVYILYMDVYDTVTHAVINIRIMIKKYKRYLINEC